MRNAGFYWIRLADEWVIGEYFEIPDCWYVTGESKPFDTDALHAINENQILPPNE